MDFKQEDIEGKQGEQAELVVERDIVTPPPPPQTRNKETEKRNDFLIQSWVINKFEKQRPSQGKMEDFMIYVI